MPYRRSPRKQKILVPVLIRVAIGVCVMTALVVTGFLLRSCTGSRKSAPAPVAQRPPAALTRVPVPEPVDASGEIAGRYYGLCRKNSVHSVADLRRAVEEDPVLGLHFAGFDWERARMGKLEQAIWSYVSFRTGSDIRRTSRPILLPAGDRYITDGRRKVRVFCCNDYDVAPPPVPVTSIAPAPLARALALEDEDSIAGNMLGRGEAVDLDNVPQVAWNVDRELGGSPFPALAGGFPPRTTHHGFPGPHTPPVPPFQNLTSHPVVTPEPGSWLLFSSGAAVFGLFLLWNRRRLGR